MLILAGVAISSVTGDNGLFRKAREATNMYKDAERDEQGALRGAENELSKLLNSSETEGGSGEDNTIIPPDPEEPEDPKTPVDPSKSYVGYYADIEGDGTVDGIIFADQVKGNTGSGKWTDDDGVYTIPTITGTKNYYVKQKDYAGPFGTKDVLSPTGEGKDRFYVMKLTNFTIPNNWFFTWYDATGTYGGKMNDYLSYTSVNFGAGKKNTADMITKWNAGGYGAKDHDEIYKDLWGQIQGEVAKGWFIPSRGEWAAFGEELGITKDNYTEKGLNIEYWSSSQSGTTSAWAAKFSEGAIRSYGTSIDCSVRMAVSF